jgi:glucokinase
MKIFALDLGGTRLKAGVVQDGAIAMSVSKDSPAAEMIASSIGDLAVELLAGEGCDGAGLCVPGLVDDHGVVRSLPGKHAGIEGVDLPGLLRETVKVDRAVVVNDAIAYATGEATRGAGVGFERVVVVTIGTGVGVTVIDRGAPVTTGMLGGGIMGGFIPISERTDGAPDSNGRPDTVEALCAAGRIAEACGTASVRDAYEAFASGDAAAIAGIAAYRMHLARALVALASAHAPDCIVLGGGPMTPDNPVTPPLLDLISERLFGSYRLSLRLAALGDNAALVGLAHLVGSA